MSDSEFELGNSGSKRRRLISVLRGRIPRVVLLAGLVAVVGAGMWLRFASGGPPGTPLTIQTDPPDHSGGCLQVALGPVRLHRAGSELQFVSSWAGQPARIAWPNGFSAWLIDGRAQLHDYDGATVAVEGDVLSDLGGASLNGIFHVCQIGTRIY